MQDQGVTLAALGILATCVGGLIWIIKFMFNRILPLIDGAVKNIDTNSRITKSADNYLRDRNGRDSEVHQELIKRLEEMPTAIEKSMKTVTDAAANRNLKVYKELIKSIPKQNVKEQHVDKVVVDGKKKNENSGKKD